jgi:NAD+ synthase/NAD+ synthase (glutamine-hydrolysing)
MCPSLSIGVIQPDPVVGDISANTAEIADEYTDLLESEPDVVVASELSLVGYPPRDLLHRRGILDAQEAALDTLAEVTVDGPPLVVGATLRTEQDTGPPVHNSAVVLRDGGRDRAYHKRLLPTYDVFDEHRYFRPGTEPVVVDVDGVGVGLTICEDAWHDAVITGKRRHELNPLLETATAGADLILTLSASPFSLDKPARREQRFLAHAERTDCPVVFANQVGGNDELIFDGHSFVAADGSILDRLAGFEVETATLDVPLSDEGTSPVPGFESERAQQARDALALGISDYFAKTGFSEAVIGLSGGIDSSVAAALAADALGVEQVYGVSLPSRVTSRQSVADARAVANNLGISFDVVPVGPAVETLSDALREYAQPLTGVALENVQARIRGDVLMGLANERGALVLTPDNKSEAAVGYCTLYGDTVGALAPLGDCYKGLVYELAESFNRDPPADAESKPVIPAAVVEKAPTAELSEGQTDADDLPPYDELDPVLESYIEGCQDGTELRDTFEDGIVDETLSRVTGAEFKRRQTPPPLRITQKALGRGWNYPVAAEYEHVSKSDGE